MPVLRFVSPKLRGLVEILAKGNSLYSLERESVLKRQKAKLLEETGRPRVHINGADGLGDLLQIGARGAANLNPYSMKLK